MSWIDALVRAIDRRGIPPWALFLGLFVALALLIITALIGRLLEG